MIQKESHHKDHQRYDVVIVGGGLTGALCALGLGRLGWSVNLLDKTLSTTTKRLIMLTPAAWNFVTSLGIAVPAKKVSCMEVFAARWGVGSGKDFSPILVGQGWKLEESPVGFCVEHSALIKDVYRVMGKEKTVVYETHCHAETLIRDPLTNRIIGIEGVRKSWQGEAKTTIPLIREASLVIASDGGRSSLRTLSQTPSVEKACGYALTLFFKHKTYNSKARQVFLPSETLAFLPGQDDEKMLVWSMSATRALMMEEWSPSLLLQEAFRRFGQREQSCEPLGEVASFPLFSTLTRTMIQPGLCFVGDAAHVVHPLLGMGASLGIMDVAQMYHSLKEARGLGLSPGNMMILKAYQRRRFAYNASILASGYGLYQLFISENFSTILAGLGLSLCDRAPWVKTMLWETFCSP